MTRDRILQLAFLALSAASAGAGAMLQQPLRAQRQQLKLDMTTADATVIKDPKTAFLQVAPGGLRALFINYLWMRSQELKQDGRFFDAKGLRDLLCDLMPHFAGVWAFHGWDMAWNISVDTHTPQERWMWVYNGVTLLRDRGLYYNPKDLILYKELAWIYFAKMGQYTDDMNLTYKRRWAGLMQQVLGAPPPGGTAQDALDAFGLVAQAPDAPAALLADAPTARFVAALEELNVPLDEGFLDYYNRLSDDGLVNGFGFLAQDPADPRQKAVADLMKSADHAAARAKVLAFVRKQVLRQRYKLDPDWMLKLMAKYGPLDWRHVNSHAVYWSSLGLHLVEGLDLNYIHALNTDRITLDSLHTLTRTGRLTVTPNPSDPDEPFVDWGPDWRFIEPASQEYITAGKMLMASDKAQKDFLERHARQPSLAEYLDLMKRACDSASLAAAAVDSPDNSYRDGHINFLANTIQLLWTGLRPDLAQRYYDQLRTLYNLKDQLYTLPLDEFVKTKLNEGGTPSVELARALWQNALVSAYRALANGDEETYRQYHDFARRTYRTFVNDFGNFQRQRPRPFEEYQRQVPYEMLVQPQRYQMYLPLLTKVRLYNALPLDIQRDLHPILARPLRQQCQAERIDFDKAFPAPPE